MPQVSKMREQQKRRTQNRSKTLRRKVHKLAGMQVIETEAEMSPRLKNLVHRTKQAYKEFVESITHLLASDERNGGFGWTSPPRNSEQLRELVADALSLVWSRFDARIGISTLIEAFATGVLDCDTSTVVLYDILKQFGMNPVIVYVKGEKRFGSHTLLKVDDLYFETTSGRFGAETLVSYTEEERKTQRPVLLGINKSPLSTVYHNIGLAMAMKNDFIGAIKYYNKAIRLDNANAFYYVTRGFARFQTGDPKGALKDLDIAIGIAPRYPEAYYVRSIVRKELGDFAGAEEDYSIANRLGATR